MDTYEIAKIALDFGFLPFLLTLFVIFFLKRDKTREKQISELNTQYEKREAIMREDGKRREDQYKEREKILVAESSRREEILKMESDKREKIIREESKKREIALLTTIDGFSKTMKEISDTMTEIKKTTFKVQHKIDNIESTLELLGKGGLNSG